MEYANFGTLADYLESQQQRPLSVREIIAIFKQIANGVCYLHSKNIVHQDLKTANVFLTLDGVVKVGDFGISRILNACQESASALDYYQKTSEVATTNKGETKNNDKELNPQQLAHYAGTLAYSSPEKCLGYPADTRCDIWSLGCILYELITLRPAFSGDSLSSLVANITQAQLVWPPNRMGLGSKSHNKALIRKTKEPKNMHHDILIRLCDLTERMITREPKQRPTADEVVACVTELATHSLTVKTSSTGQTANRRGYAQQRLGVGGGTDDGRQRAGDNDFSDDAFCEPAIGSSTGCQTTLKSAHSLVYQVRLDQQHVEVARVNLPRTKRFKRLAKGTNHYVALTNDHIVYGWGARTRGQLGLCQLRPPAQCASSSFSAVPTTGDQQREFALASMSQAPVALRPFVMNELSGRKIVQVCAGHEFTVFLSKTGLVLTCGSGQHGCLGLGNARDVYVPTLVASLLSNDVVGVSCGPEHVVVICGNGRAYAWGTNTDGRLGIGTAANNTRADTDATAATTPPTPNTVDSASTSSSSIVYTPTLVDLTGDADIKHVYCGDTCTLFVDARGTCYACGLNANNRLGLDKPVRSSWNLWSSNWWRNLRTTMMSAASTKSTSTSSMFRHTSSSVRSSRRHRSRNTSTTASVTDAQQQHQQQQQLTHRRGHSNASDSSVGHGTHTDSRNRTTLTMQCWSPRKLHWLTATGAKLVTCSLAPHHAGYVLDDGRLLIMGRDICSHNEAKRAQAHGPLCQRQKHIKQSNQTNKEIRCKAPKQVLGGRVKRVCCTSAFTLAMTNDERVYFWGTRSHLYTPTTLDAHTLAMYGFEHDHHHQQQQSLALTLGANQSRKSQPRRTGISTTRRQNTVEMQLVATCSDECVVRIGATNDTLMDTIQKSGSDTPIIQVQDPHLVARDLDELWILDYKPEDTNTEADSAAANENDILSSGQQSATELSANDYRLMPAPIDDDDDAILAFTNESSREKSNRPIGHNSNCRQRKFKPKYTCQKMRHDVILRPQSIVGLYVPSIFTHDGHSVRMSNIYCFDEQRFMIVFDTTNLALAAQQQQLQHSPSISTMSQNNHHQHQQQHQKVANATQEGKDKEREREKDNDNNNANVRFTALEVAQQQLSMQLAAANHNSHSQQNTATTTPACHQQHTNALHNSDNLEMKKKCITRSVSNVSSSNRTNNNTRHMRTLNSNRQISRQNNCLSTLLANKSAVVVKPEAAIIHHELDVDGNHEIFEQTIDFDSESASEQSTIDLTQSCKALQVNGLMKKKPIDVDLNESIETSCEDMSISETCESVETGASSLNIESDSCNTRDSSCSMSSASSRSSSMSLNSQTTMTEARTMMTGNDHGKNKHNMMVHTVQQRNCHLEFSSLDARYDERNNHTINNNDCDVSNERQQCLNDHNESMALNHDNNTDLENDGDDGDDDDDDAINHQMYVSQSLASEEPFSISNINDNVLCTTARYNYVQQQQHPSRAWPIPSTTNNTISAIVNNNYNNSSGHNRRRRMTSSGSSDVSFVGRAGGASSSWHCQRRRHSEVNSESLGNAFEEEDSTPDWVRRELYELASVSSNEINPDDPTSNNNNNNNECETKNDDNIDMINDEYDRTKENVSINIVSSGCETTPLVNVKQNVVVQEDSSTPGVVDAAKEAQGKETNEKGCLNTTAAPRDIGNRMNEPTKIGPLIQHPRAVALLIESPIERVRKLLSSPLSLKRSTQDRSGRSMNHKRLPPSHQRSTAGAATTVAPTTKRQAVIFGHPPKSGGPATTRAATTASNFKVYGCPLKLANNSYPLTCFARTDLHRQLPVPYVVARLCNYIEENSAQLTHEGIFRVSGNSRLCGKLRTLFDRLGDAPLESESVDVATSASMLKMYLRELPEPLIPTNLNGLFLEAAKKHSGSCRPTAPSFLLQQSSSSHHNKRNSIDDDLAKQLAFARDLANLVKKLPAENYNSLRYLCCFLFRVSLKQQFNKMCAASLGIVFGPNIFRLPSQSYKGLKEQELTNKCVACFISHYRYIFDSTVTDPLGNTIDTRNLEQELSKQSTGLTLTSFDVESSTTASTTTDQTTVQRQSQCEPPPGGVLSPGDGQCERITDVYGTNSETTATDSNRLIANSSRRDRPTTAVASSAFMNMLRRTIGSETKPRSSSRSGRSGSSRRSQHYHRQVLSVPNCLRPAAAVTTSSSTIHQVGPSGGASYVVAGSHSKASMHDSHHEQHSIRCKAPSPRLSASSTRYTQRSSDCGQTIDSSAFVHHPSATIVDPDQTYCVEVTGCVDVDDDDEHDHHVHEVYDISISSCDLNDDEDDDETDDSEESWTPTGSTSSASMGSHSSLSIESTENQLNQNDTSEGHRLHRRLAAATTGHAGHTDDDETSIECQSMTSYTPTSGDTDSDESHVNSMCNDSSSSLSTSVTSSASSYISTLSSTQDDTPERHRFRCPALRRRCPADKAHPITTCDATGNNGTPDLDDDDCFVARPCHLGAHQIPCHLIKGDFKELMNHQSTSSHDEMCNLSSSCSSLIHRPPTSSLSSSQCAHEPCVSLAHYTDKQTVALNNNNTNSNIPSKYTKHSAKDHQLNYGPSSNCYTSHDEGDCGRMHQSSDSNLMPQILIHEQHLKLQDSVNNKNRLTENPLDTKITKSYGNNLSFNQKLQTPHTKRSSSASSLSCNNNNNRATIESRHRITSKLYDDVLYPTTMAAKHTTRIKQKATETSGVNKVLATTKRTDLLPSTSTTATSATRAAISTAKRRIRHSRSRSSSQLTSLLRIDSDQQQQRNGNAQETTSSRYRARRRGDPSTRRRHQQQQIRSKDAERLKRARGSRVHCRHNSTSARDQHAANERRKRARCQSSDTNRAHVSLPDINDIVDALPDVGLADALIDCSIVDQQSTEHELIGDEITIVRRFLSDELLFRLGFTSSRNSIVNADELFGSQRKRSHSHDSTMNTLHLLGASSVDIFMPNSRHEFDHYQCGQYAHHNGGADFINDCTSNTFGASTSQQQMGDRHSCSRTNLPTIDYATDMKWNERHRSMCSQEILGCLPTGTVGRTRNSSIGIIVVPSGRRRASLLTSRRRRDSSKKSFKGKKNLSADLIMTTDTKQLDYTTHSSSDRFSDQRINDNISPTGVVRQERRTASASHENVPDTSSSPAQTKTGRVYSKTDSDIVIHCGSAISVISVLDSNNRDIEESGSVDFVRPQQSIEAEQSKNLNLDCPNQFSKLEEEEEDEEEIGNGTDTVLAYDPVYKNLSLVKQHIRIKMSELKQLLSGSINANDQLSLLESIESNMRTDQQEGSINQSMYTLKDLIESSNVKCDALSCIDELIRLRKRQCDLIFLLKHYYAYHRKTPTNHSQSPHNDSAITCVETSINENNQDSPEKNTNLCSSPPTCFNLVGDKSAPNIQSKEPACSYGSICPVEFIMDMEQRLERKRIARRPFKINLMTRDQLKREKIELQRNLLWYESLFGRPTTEQQLRLVVSSWSLAAGATVVEVGDDWSKLVNDYHDTNNHHAVSQHSYQHIRRTHSDDPNHRRYDNDISDENNCVSSNHNLNDRWSTSINSHITSYHGIAKPRVLLLCNHISTADVPMLMQSFSSLTNQCLLWVLDAQFKFTNFGLVCSSHGDYFISRDTFSEGSLREQCLKHPDRNLMVLFPEGGFLRKRLEGSNRYAAKTGLPATKYVTHPRFGAFKDLTDPLVGITHLVDCTLLYDSLSEPLSILDIAFGSRQEPVFIHYRLFERDKITEGLNDWLQKVWLEKEKLMQTFYEDRDTFYRNVGHKRLRIKRLDWIKLMAVHFFYLLIFTICYRLFLLTCVTANNLSDKIRTVPGNSMNIAIDEMARINPKKNANAWPDEPPRGLDDNKLTMYSDTVSSSIAPSY
ncbi:Serine/threonine-protein kinase Nek8, partial [Fragariocoptes setiger]